MCKRQQAQSIVEYMIVLTTVVVVIVAVGRVAVDRAMRQQMQSVAGGIISSEIDPTPRDTQDTDPGDPGDPGDIPCALSPDDCLPLKKLDVERCACVCGFRESCDKGERWSEVTCECLPRQIE